MTGQPQVRDADDNPLWVFDYASVEPVEAGGMTPSAVIDQPNEFSLRCTFTNEGLLGDGLEDEMGHITHYVQNLGTGDTFALPGPDDFGWTGDTLVEETGPYTTGPVGGGANLEVGTYLITSVVTFDAPHDHVAGFNQTVVMVNPFVP